ncbi:MAG: polyphosphate polymerase domain-containing protein [Propionibacteriaceae bacterium]|nr:polyphosphate polymerase domain-containing protein [Propionibacteriaceae bacterium]
MTAVEDHLATVDDLPRITSRSKAVLHSVTGRKGPVSLDEVMEVAGLQTRHEKKYLLTPREFVELSAALEDFRVLQIDGKRLFGYESAYFDSPDLALFRAHRQGRRQRYKVRTRTYLDSGESLFEVKLKGGRGETVKLRLPYEFEDRSRITGEAQDFLEDALRDSYDAEPPELTPSLTTRYTRATFVDVADGARLTCDIDLACTGEDTTEYGPDLILVESKSTGSGRADEVLAAMGVRPVSVSKYCVGIALTNPDLPANKWNRMLRTRFGWEREYDDAA